MSIRRTILVNTPESQIVEVDGDYAMQTYDQNCIVTKDDALVTLPQDPFTGESHTIYADSPINFLITGGPSNPLAPLDPMLVPAGSIAQFKFGTSGSEWIYALTSIFGPPISLFGDGSDGSATLDGIAVFPFANLVGTTYTLTRDVFFETLRVNVGIRLDSGGFRILANNELDNLGTISFDGNAGALGVAGAARASHTVGGSAAGGAGGNNGVGAAGTNGTQGLAGGTGAGGAGGAGGVNAGGIAGTYTSFSADDGTVHSVPWSVMGSVRDSATGTLLLLKGGAGGGGGGSDNAGVTGGGGGSGGGTLLIAAYVIDNKGSIQANGGNGAAASGAGGNGGGGGGGGGGTVLITTHVKIGIGPITATGGAGGTVVTAGIAGTAGVNGNVIFVSD